jgi:hypothetical protein
VAVETRLQPGERITHHEFGQGVVLDPARDGYLRAFFGVGERRVLLLSATPHQGKHFQFWMLAQLLNSTLFGSPEEMLEHRHRLNTVMFRRTKADACQPDGSPLFARRWVHTE